MHQHAEDDFPTLAVYGPVRHPALRLITRGGEFDEANNRHLDNIVVYAEPVERPA